jgi:predicted O-methyltransferase YrrM
MSAPEDLTRQPHTDPLEIYRYRDGLYAVDLLTAAVCEFDFFTWLDAHPGDAGAIARGLGFAPRPLDVMLSLFTADGFLRREGADYHLTARAREHLVSTSPFFLGPYYASLKDRPVARDYGVVLRTGHPANWGSYRDEKPWDDAMRTDAFATSFTAAMDCRGAYLGPALARAAPLAGRRSLLDIAGGSGVYACTLVAHHAGLRATVLERPPVDGIARTMVRRRGWESRVIVTAGDMFSEPLPSGHDVHLFSNVLHDWDLPGVRALLASSFAALAPGGLILIHDAHLNGDKSGPLPVARYSALLMAITEGRCYGTAEMAGLLTEAGFTRFGFRETVADRSVVWAEKPCG